MITPASAVWGAIEEAGLSIPDDISVAGYDGIPMSEVVKPRLTTVRQDTEQIGKRTVRETGGSHREAEDHRWESQCVPVVLEKGKSIKNLIENP
ncbi:MAG: substrate-binding domain-containing protein [Lachnospiraceae bacterium]